VALCYAPRRASVLAVACALLAVALLFCGAALHAL
jgi:hypothetical protein